MTTTLHLLTIRTRHDDISTLHLTRQAAEDAAYDYVAEFWDQDGPGYRDGTPIPQDRLAAVDAYFKGGTDESYDITEVATPEAPAAQSAGRDLLIPADLAQRILDAIDGATTSASNDAERIEDAVPSDGYTEDDIEDAKAFVEDLRELYGEIRELRDKAGSALPPIVYADDAIDSWQAHLDSIRGWNAQLTLNDGSKHEVAIRGAEWGDDHLAHLLVAYWNDGREPDENTDTEHLPVDRVVQIRVH